MSASPEFTLSEAGGAQLQALQTLSALGWRYVTRAEAERQRGHRRSTVLLEDILSAQLSRLNHIRRGHRSHPFSETNIITAIDRLRDARFITTVINKFKAGLNKRRVADDSADIFVLVDESHRSQYGDLDSLHARMREV